jgi:glycosyltransferase involved in cell wall biosynthesis
MTALAGHRGHAVRRHFGDDGSPLRAPLGDIDVLFVHRNCEERALRLTQEAKGAGAAVVWDNDDDMGAMPKSVASHKHLGGMAWERRLAQMRRLFRSADLVTAPSRALAERLGAWGAPATDVTENYLPDPPQAIVRRPGEGVTIGWVAGLEHAMDVQQLPIVAALQRLLDERADVRVMSAGLRLGLHGDRYEHVVRIPPPTLSTRLAELDFGIAPLADTVFNRSRSNVKLKEYALSGTPWLASPIGPYADMGERQGGRLVPDDGWHDALVRLADKSRERRRLGKRAARWASGETISKNLGVWEARLADAVALSRGAAGAQRTA